MAEQAFIKIISIPEYQDNGLKGKIADYVDDMRSQYRYLPDEFLNDLLKNISGLFRCMREEWDCFLNPYLETPAGTPIYVLASQKEKEEEKALLESGDLKNFPGFSGAIQNNLLGIRGVCRKHEHGTKNLHVQIFWK